MKSLSALALLPCVALAQDPPLADNQIRASLLTKPPAVDGQIDEEEWKEASRFSGLVDTLTGAPAAEGGTFWLGYDQRFIYFAARLEDREPASIAATEYRTNVSLQGNDVVSLFVDPFANYSDGNVFQMNARGATNISIAGGRAAKREWLGEILSKGRITATGWEVEARIPWGIMRLPASGQRDVIFNVYRYHRRLQREYSWRYTEGGRIQNFGRWLGVQIPPAPPNTLKLLPYTYLGWDEREGHVFNSGLDLRTALTDQMDLVGTVNPDFRNIENDVLSLDFSYFERLAGETRPFFLEGGEFFRTSGDAPIFTSQRIRAFDVGLKTFGRLDDATTLAVLDTTDLGEENALAVNVRRQITSRSFARLAYSGYDRDELRNRVGFLQYSQGWGLWEAFMQHSFSDDSELGGGQRNNFGVTYGGNGVFGVLEYSSVTERYEPRIGFAPQKGFGGLNGVFEVVRPAAKGPFMETGFEVSAVRWDRLDGGPYFHNLAGNYSLTWRNGTDLDFGAEFPSFQGSDDSIYFVSLEHPRGDMYRRWQVDYRTGEIGGHRLDHYRLSFAYRPVERLQLQGMYETQRLERREEQAILSANYDLGDDRSISGRLVRRQEDTNWYLAYRRSGGRGLDYFVILGDPNARRFRESLVLKAVYPLELVIGR